MDLKIFLITFLISVGMEQTTCSKILLIPGAVYSHVNFFSTAGKALKDDGHEVYVLTVEKFASAATNNGLTPIIHKNPDGSANSFEKLEPKISEVTKGEISVPKMFMSFMPLMTEFCQDLNRNKPLIEQLENLKVDLVINDGVFFFTCLYVVSYRLNVKYITLTAMHDPWTRGVTGLPSIEPAQLTSYTNRMTFYQRLTNLIPFIILSINPVSPMYSKELVGEFAPHLPYKTIQQIISDSEITLVNHEVTCIGYPRVSAPHYQFIGGSSTKPAGPLLDEFQKFADGAKEGLIVFSFGSVKGLHAIWPSIKPKVMGALGRLPQRAVVQYALDDVDGVPENVKLVKWLPQNDLLGHPNTKVFITHGGNNGQLEAVYHGIPILTIPFTGDQFSNGNQARERGFGLVLDRFELTEENLYDTIKELIMNPSYSQKIKKCSDIVKSMPPSKERLVFWVNHVLQFGGEHLRSPAVDMPMYQVLMLDVFAFIFLVLAVFIFSICFCCKRLIRWCSKKSTKTKED